MKDIKYNLLQCTLWRIDLNNKTITPALVIILALSILSPFGYLVAEGQTASGINICFSPNPAPNSPILITAYVYGNNPTGNITWSTNSDTAVLIFTLTPLDNETFSATTTFTDTTAGVVTIGASYSGDSNNYQCAEFTILVIYSSTYRIPTSVSIFFSHDISVANSPVVCTATVSGYYPTGIIDWSSNSSTGVFNFNLRCCPMGRCPIVLRQPLLPTLIQAQLLSMQVIAETR